MSKCRKIATAWPLRRRMNFILYSMIVGPCIGTICLSFLILFVFMSEIAAIFVSPPVFFVAYILGAPQAALTGFIIQRRFRDQLTVPISAIISSALLGWMFGSVMNYVAVYALLIENGLRTNEKLNWFLSVTLFVPLVAGVISTVILWALRPRKWVGL